MSQLAFVKTEKSRLLFVLHICSDNTIPLLAIKTSIARKMAGMFVLFFNRINKLNKTSTTKLALLLIKWVKTLLILS